ncbi:LysR family transcriptional regulator [Rhizobium sp. C4]|uniref:LysR family transcriptional regulator n=1 Tax=Rhizobium sp. C4 TaxID=1349800 RepID=UPI001E42E94E|nr:LysR family transcriptional regulator [Rhizobium sp. C4]MCD2176057.1 LysR family transcriptional regulator [Rhizobium sp. C4]
MEVKQLRTLVHVAELGSFTLAAERLHIAQSALTRQIQTLEDELQVRLFVRHGRGVTLTLEGTALFDHATVVLRELDQARAELRNNELPLSGEVSFGVPPTVADVLSGVLIEKFLTLHPQVRLKVVSGYSGYILDWLQRGIVDIGILYEATHPATIKSRHLLTERLCLIERATSPLGGDAEVAFADAMTVQHVLPGRQHGLRLLLEGLAAKYGFALEPVVEADSLPVQIDLVKRAVGATILPLLPVYNDVQAGILTARPIVLPDITRKLILAHSVDRPMSPAARQFSKLVISEVPELVRSGHWKGFFSGDEEA